MSKIRIILFSVIALFTLWLICPIFIGIIHIGMLWPLPFLAVALIFIAKPSLFKAIYKKTKVLTCIAAALYCITVIVSLTCVCAMTASSFDDPPQNASVVVLGCKVNGEEPSRMLKSRIDAAYEYLISNPDSKCIATGAKGINEDISEAQAICNELVKMGIDKQRIFIEDQSVNTEQNLENSAQIIDENDLDKNIVIASDRFHILRAKLYAKNCELNASSACCDTYLPLSPGYWAREILALLKAVIL